MTAARLFPLAMIALSLCVAGTAAAAGDYRRVVWGLSSAGLIWSAVG